MTTNHFSDFQYPTAQEAIEAFIIRAMDQSEHDAASKVLKAEKDEIASRLIPYIEEVGVEGKSYEFAPGGRVLGTLRRMTSPSYRPADDTSWAGLVDAGLMEITRCEPAENITYEDLVRQGLLVREETPYLRWYPRKEAPAKRGKRSSNDELTDEEV